MKSTGEAVLLPLRCSFAFFSVHITCAMKLPMVCAASSCIGAQGKARVAAIRHAADGFYFLKNATTTAPGPACVPITLPTVV